MIEQLLKYYEKCHNIKQSLELEIQHDKVSDWYICIWHGDSHSTIFKSDGTSLNLLCANAYIELENWAKNYEELEDIECNL